MSNHGYFLPREHLCHSMWVLSFCLLQSHRAADVNTNNRLKLKYHLIILDRLSLCLSCVFLSGLVGSVGRIASRVRVDSQVMIHYQMRSGVAWRQPQPSKSSGIIRQTRGQSKNWLQTLTLDLCYGVTQPDRWIQLALSSIELSHYKICSLMFIKFYSFFKLHV